MSALDERKERKRISRKIWATKNPDKERARRKRWNDKHLAEYRKTPRSKMRRSAGRAISNAIRDGKLTRQPCEVRKCKEPFAEAHHDDYSKPLDVRWLCKKHHTEHHVKLRRKQNESV